MKPGTWFHYATTGIRFLEGRPPPTLAEMMEVRRMLMMRAEERAASAASDEPEEETGEPVKMKIPGETKEERLQTFRKAFPDVAGQIALGALDTAAVKTISYDADPIDPSSVLNETARNVVPGIKAAVEAYRANAGPAPADQAVAEIIGGLVQAFPDAARRVFVLHVVPGLRIRASSLLGADPDVTAEFCGRWYVRDASRPGPPRERDTQEEAEALVRALVESRQDAIFVRVTV